MKLRQRHPNTGPVIGLSLLIMDGKVVTDPLTGEGVVRLRTEREPMMLLRLTGPVE